MADWILVPRQITRYALPALSGAFAPQSGDFGISWDAIPTLTDENVVTGLSFNAPAVFADVACIVRFFTGGNIDARNGGTFATDAGVNVPYSAGTTYHVRLNVRLSNHTYDVYVTPQGQSEIVLATNFAFRTEQAAIATLNYLGKIVVTGDAVLSHMALLPPTVIVNSVGFNLVLPATAGEAVGQMTASGAPTSWAITAGNAPGYFAIDNTGAITVTTAGAAGITAGNYALTCTASNGFGSGSGIASVAFSSGAAGPFTSQSGDFTISWDVVPTQNAEDVVTGLSFNAPAVFSDIACAVQFFTNGNINVRNGGAYVAGVPYSAGTNYHLRLIVRLSNHTYDVYVTPQGQSETLIANNFAFRTEQAAVASLNYLGKLVTTGDATLSNMTGPTALPPQAPVVTNGTFSLTVPATNGQIVGTMTASGFPTSWAITAGNSSGYFAIANNGDVTVTSAGASGLSGTATVNLTVQASNATGSGSGTATVNYAPAGTFTFPLSKSDSRFASNTAFSGATPDTGLVVNKNWDESPGYTNGGATWGWHPSAVGTLTIRKCILDGRECVDIFGAPSRSCTIEFDQCFLNVHGFNSDHADGIQGLVGGYSAGNSTLNVTNTTIRCYNDAESAALFGPGNVESDCFFWADGNGGDITFDNCLFWGGARCFYCYSDGSVINLRVRNCFFVPSSNSIDAATPQLVDTGTGTGGSMNVLEWSNNRYATISNGVLTPGPIRNNHTLPWNSG